MTAGTIFFSVCSLVSLVGAIATVTARNPIRCAVGLLATILGIAGLFLALSAQFLAAIQLIVYAGAVVVLFVFVIMLLGPDAGETVGEQAAGKAQGARYFGGALLAILAGITMWLMVRVSPGVTAFPEASAEHGTAEAVGGLLFTAGIIPFELTTALLIVSAIGAIAVARSPRVKKAMKSSPSPTVRLFHGPLHPRDAGRPLERQP